MMNETSGLNSNRLEKHELSVIPTVECKPYNALISSGTCAARYLRYSNYNGKGKKLQSRHQNQFMDNRHCRNCETGKEIAAANDKARSRQKRKIDRALRANITNGLSGKKEMSFIVLKLGWGIFDLIKHIENQFKPGMTWDNHSREGWHIDHIIPACAFHYESYDDPKVRQCWSLSNLQPLWSDAHYKKGRNIQSPL